MIDACRRNGITMRRATIDEIRVLAAGGVRWAHENGMRVPKDLIKTATLIGGIGDWASADVSLFLKQFVGHPEDLRQRLLREHIDTYLKRTDIHFVFSEAPYIDQAS